MFILFDSGKFKTYSCSVLFLLLVIFNVSVSASEIIFLTHNLKDQVSIGSDGLFYGKENTGVRAFHIELIKEMINRAGHPEKLIREYPFKRGWETVQKNSGYAMFNVARIPERESTVKWVGPIVIFDSYLYEAVKSSTGIRKLKGAQNLRVCVVKGNNHDQFLTKAGFTNLIRVKSYAQCFQMVYAGRADLSPSSTIMFKQRTNAAGLASKDFRNTGVFVSRGQGYIAFSKATPDKDIKKWQRILDEIKRSGKFKKLSQKYLIH